MPEKGSEALVAKKKLQVQLLLCSLIQSFPSSFNQQLDHNLNVQEGNEGWFRWFIVRNIVSGAFLMFSCQRGHSKELVTIRLTRTDTTLDHSQKAEKVWT